jgi:MFS superfamily sulfate permease-like transporter
LRLSVVTGFLFGVAFGIVCSTLVLANRVNGLDNIVSDLRRDTASTSATLTSFIAERDAERSR